jgi:hypothetical protein
MNQDGLRPDFPGKPSPPQRRGHHVEAIQGFFYDKFSLASLSVLFWLIALLGLSPFWAGRYYLLFTDAGDDCINSFWPFTELVLRWLANPTEWLPELGLGSPALGLYGYGFLNPLFLAALLIGKSVHSVVYAHVLIWSSHAYVGCVSIYYFFKLYGLRNRPSGLLALIYA